MDFKAFYAPGIYDAGAYSDCPVRPSVRPSVRQSVRPYEIHIVNKSYAIAHKALILAWMLSVITLNILTSPNLILTLTLT